MKEDTTETSQSESALNQPNSIETLGRRFFASLILSALVGWLFVIIKNTFSAIAIAVFLGSLLSFFMFQLLQFFLNKFLEKELTFDEISYVKQGIFTVANNFVPFVLVPLILYFFSIPITDLSSLEGGKLELWIWTPTVENPFHWIFVGGLLAFSYRLKILKEKLTRLQSSFKIKKTDKENALQ